MCSVFPTLVSCNVNQVGAGGGDDRTNAICILSQNIVNEKIYLIIWFAMVALMLISILNFLFRISTLIFEEVRKTILLQKVGWTTDSRLKDSVDVILCHCHVGDWFVLNQLSSNVTHYFFRNLLKSLKTELARKPKVSSRTVNRNDIEMENTSKANYANLNDTDSKEDMGDLLH